jgi:preprotein translocase subunit SecF
MGASTDDQQLGERFARLEAGQEELGRRIDDMKATGTKEHDEVKALLIDLKEEVGKKADKSDVTDVAGRVDSLETERDQRVGRNAVVGLVSKDLVLPIVVAVVTALILIIVAKGG